MRARRSTWLLIIATNIGLIAAGLAAVELHLRSRPAQVSLFYAPDKELGWAPARNVSQTFTATDEGGTSYRIDFKTNPDGFREWGNPDANRPSAIKINGIHWRQSSMWSSRINSVPLPIMPSKRIENNASRIVVLGAIAGSYLSQRVSRQQPQTG